MTWAASCFTSMSHVKKEAAEFAWWASRGRQPERASGPRDHTFWRELGPRPADKAAAGELIRAVIDEQVERLERIVTELEQDADIEANDGPDLADLAAFDPGPGLERHRRHQASMCRELLRTVETLRRLRKEDRGRVVDGQGQGSLTRASASTPPTQPRGEGNAHCPCRCSPGEGSPTGATASTPPIQPHRDEDHEPENATIKAKSESAQEAIAMKVTSRFQYPMVDDQSQNPGQSRQPEEEGVRPPAPPLVEEERSGWG
jgi:hypothetical protein